MVKSLQRARSLRSRPMDHKIRKIAVGGFGQATNRSSDRGRVADRECRSEYAGDLAAPSVSDQGSDCGDRVLREGAREGKALVQRLEMLGKRGGGLMAAGHPHHTVRRDLPLLQGKSVLLEGVFSLRKVPVR